ncbi:MAG TPA: nucleotide exchange factor GrpE [Pyrinomonadaceae bacterium]|nr:nucleotide exchange factor GrpE [Pyrinomonadaceae bacterium]
MVNKRRQTSNRIPVRFVDEEHLSRQSAASSERDAQGRELDEGDLSPEEIGRASSYEDETEVRRRINRGAEDDSEAGRERADDADVAGGPPYDELPERREDQDEAETASGSAKETAGEGAASQRTADEASGPVLAELVATRAELKRVETERTESLDRLARLQADFDNYRKRVERERGETYQRMVGDVAGKLLPVLDNLRRALDAEATLEASESEEFRHFLHGVELIYKQLNDVLESLGVQPVAAVGQPFDPHLHEAIVTEETDEYEPDTVMQEIRRGYRLGEKLLRPAMVKVATRP